MQPFCNTHSDFHIKKTGEVANISSMTNMTCINDIKIMLFKNSDDCKHSAL